MYNHDKFMMYLCIGGSVLSPNSSLYGSLNQSSYSNLTCPVNAADTRNCTAMLSINPLCMNGSKDLVIQCSRPLTMTMTSTIMGKILNHRSVLFLPFFLFAATTMTTASSSSTTVTAITSSTSSSRIATSTSPTPSTTSNAPSSTINIRFIVSIATGGAVFVLTVLVVVAVLIIVTCLCVRNARRKSRREKSQKPVELKGYND